MIRRVKVLIVEGHKLLQQVLARGLSKEQFYITGITDDPNKAFLSIAEEKPDIILLNEDLCSSSGIDFAKNLIFQSPMPIVMLCKKEKQSRHRALIGLHLGAIDFIQIPIVNSTPQIQSVIEEIRDKITMASMTDVSYLDNIGLANLPMHANERAIIIGAASGGIDNIRKIIEKFPSGMPPVLVAPQMDGFSANHYAKTLNQNYRPYVKVAHNNDLLLPNQILIAPEKHRIEIEHSSDGNRVKISNSSPSIKILLQSAARELGNSGIGVILSPIGEDEKVGLKAMNDHGAITITQSQEGVANNIASQDSLPVESIASHIIDILECIEAVPPIHSEIIRIKPPSQNK